MPDLVARSPRRDDTAADAKTLEQLGRIDPQPTPSEVETEPNPVGEAAALSAALTEAGVAATAEDQAAVEALAGLDAATVATVTRWLQTKTKPDTPAK